MKELDHHDQFRQALYYCSLFEIMLHRTSNLKRTTIMHDKSHASSGQYRTPTSTIRSDNKHVVIRKTTESIIVIIIAILLTANLGFFNCYFSTARAIHNSNNTSINGKNNTSKTTPAADKCNPSLWNFIANPQGRFKILNQCVTVTGTVLSVQYEPDGDTDFPLALDSPYKNMVNQTNFNHLMHGGIWSEMICQHSEDSSAVEAFKKGECNGYIGPIFMCLKQGNIFK